MQALQIDTQEQIKRINLVLLKSRQDESNRCDMKGYFMYTQYGNKLCPVCDADLITEYKERMGE